MSGNTNDPLIAPTSLSTQVVEAITNGIRSGSLPIGTRLPPERALAEKFGMSRVTIRRALAELARSGLIESQRGRGTFILGRVLGEKPNALMSFSDLGRDRGLLVAAHVLANHLRPAELDEAETFGIAPGAELFVLDRIRMLDGRPICLDTSRVPAARVPNLKEVDFTTASLYQTLRDNGAAAVRADYSVYATAATVEQGQLLDVTAGFPLLQTKTTAYAADGKIVEIGDVIYRGDRYRFRATLGLDGHV